MLGLHPRKAIVTACGVIPKAAAMALCVNMTERSPAQPTCKPRAYRLWIVGRPLAGLWIANRALTIR